MSDDKVVEMNHLPVPLTDSQKLKLRDIQLKIANITSSKLKMQADFAELDKLEAKAVEQYNNFLSRYSEYKEEYGLDYETLNWVPLKERG
jgi:hypothetical protein